MSGLAKPSHVREQIEEHLQHVLNRPAMFDGNPHALQGRIEGLISAWGIVVGRSSRVHEHLHQLRRAEGERVYAESGQTVPGPQEPISIAQGHHWKSPQGEARDLVAQSYRMIWNRLNNAIDVLGSLASGE